MKKVFIYRLLCHKHPLMVKLYPVSALAATCGFVKLPESRHDAHLCI